MKRVIIKGRSLSEIFDCSLRERALIEILALDQVITLQPSSMSEIKGPSPDAKVDGSSLRIAIVHARWNKVIIDALVAGALKKLKEAGVKESNIVVESVPGSFELPIACSRCVSLYFLQMSRPKTFQDDYRIAYSSCI